MKCTNNWFLNSTVLQMSAVLYVETDKCDLLQSIIISTYVCVVPVE
jgi:hypothetical protein